MEEFKIGCILSLIYSIIFTALSFLVAWIVMLLWNFTISDMFSVPDLTYWKAFGLYWLCSVLLVRVPIEKKW